jgi:Xaa-Pro aminopeptidase
MTKNPIPERLSQLRQLMNAHHADFYFVPSTDPHRNEYMPPCYERRVFICGFDGSAGDVIVGKNQAYLWTDPRYFLQAEQQLDLSHYQIMKIGQGETPPIDRWLTTQSDGVVFATDPKVISINQAQKISAALTEVNGKLVTTDENLVDQVWHDRPKLVLSPIRIQPEKYAGESAAHKLAKLREQMRAAGADAIVVTILDAIAWLFNIRGSDVDYNPLVISYAIVTDKTATFFVDPSQVTAADKKYFASIDVDIANYSEFKNALKRLQGTVWVDPNSASYWVAQQLTHAKLYLAASPITLMKAVKNPVEVAGMYEAHRLDAIAVIKFLHWLENHWQQGVTELSAEDKLMAIRREEPQCVDLSFHTIVGFGIHGAVIHYHATKETDITIDNTSMLVVDSGGQYPFGTTDITRTIHLGTPTAEQMHHYTLVLKGHLALRHAIFPDGTCGEHVNALAHQYLWQEALDFGHGTGHGVGCYLCVHEGPQVIASRNTGVPLKPGMVVSNEPGLYLTGQYGIRIENLCVIMEKYQTNESASGHGPFYGLDDLTLIPYCRRLINKADLSAEEIQWINDYHQRVYKTLIDAMPSAELRQWLTQATAAL